MCIFMNICLSVTTTPLLNLPSLPIHNTSALVGYTEFQYGDELPLLIAARGLLIFCLRWRDFLFVIRKLLQKLGSDFFGWRLCVVDVCVRVRCSWHSRALGGSHFSLSVIPSFHQYMDTEPRLKPPADWTVCFQFNLIFRLFYF